MKHSPKVFVVDDDLAVLESVDALLRTHGYDVRCFSSAEEFIAQHHPTQVGCVLVDLWIPGMGGSELLRHLQESGSLLSVVIISGLIDSTVSDEHENVPVRSLAMPYKVQTFLTMVEDAVAGSIRRRVERKYGS